MTRAEWWEVIKTVVVIVYGIIGALAVFGPLAEYSQYLVLAATIVSIIAGALGITLTRPTTQVSNIKERKAAQQ